MNSSPTLSPEEHEQLAQTIEMFEVIVQANPQDSQSMEILKDAYSRMGRELDAIGVSKRLAHTFCELGQLSAAILEYEWILQREPDNPEIIAALGEVEEKMHRSAQAKAEASSAMSGIDLDYRAAVTDTGTLITTAQTQHPDGDVRNEIGSLPSPADDGNEPLGKFLVQHRIVSENAVLQALERVQRHNRQLGPNTPAASMIDELVNAGAADLETILSALVDRSKIAYIPLEYYDVDRQVVRMLPETITLGRLIIPFDIMSRTIMVATANPFDSAGREAVQRLLDYSVQWHLATPAGIFRVLNDNYKAAATGGPTIQSPVPMPAPAPPPPAAMPAPRLATNGNTPPAPVPAPASPAADTSAFRIVK